ncbi:excinuclease ABC subunit A [Campylobacter mucosalis]|uniref:Putative membrane protein n=1 Tax=Campylobacter mucosalis CCUG 21559 TaxID=1032067 RepID=A0A6G5QEW7_9BACT|nr:excinuclease ABC subunit A [Campylobacter mucosalis]QCD44164.1 putative membrane protein [Campylobacter mucosalis CCUG 21559]
MRILILFFTFLLPIFGANLLTYNVYERVDRVDIMLSFDAPYEGNIFQKREKDTTSLILNSLSYEEKISKSVNSKIFDEFSIEPRQNSLSLNLKSKEPIIVNASKTTDGFGLRIRVTPKNTPQQLQNLPQASVSLQTAPEQSEPIVDTKYFMVLGVLLALLVFLFLLKKFMIAKQSSNIKANKIQQKSANWLFPNQNADVNIIFERPLDQTNRLVLLSYENRKYLVILGSSNVLLDRFGEENIQNESDFRAFFEENKKKLGAFLQDRQNNLNSYKDKLDIEQ